MIQMSLKKIHYQAKIQDILEKNSIHSASVDLNQIAKTEGISIHKRPMNDSVSAALDLRDAYNPLILVNSSHSQLRQRFSIGHELGHYFLDHNRGSVHVDSKILFRRKDSDKDDRKKEREANQFAAELLMPSSWLMKELIDEQGNEHSFWEKEDFISELSHKYQVSVSAMAIRLEELNLMPKY